MRRHDTALLVALALGLLAAQAGLGKALLDRHRAALLERQLRHDCAAYGRINDQCCRRVDGGATCALTAAVAGGGQ